MITLFRRLPGPLRLLVALISLDLAFLAVYRALFFVTFAGSSADGTAAGTLVQAAWIGLRFDLRLVLILALPFCVAAWVPALAPMGSTRRRRIWLAAFGSLWSVVTLAYAMDLGHYDYLRRRLDATAIELLLAPSIAVEAGWQSFPVVWGALAVILAVALYVVAARFVVLGAIEAEAVSTPIRAQAGAVAVACVLVAAGLYGKASWYPLRWSDAYFTTNDFVTALGTNPVLHVADTWKVRNTTWDEEGFRERYAAVADYLEVDDPDPETLSLRRTRAPRVEPPFRPNVVIIFMESLAAFKVGAFGNQAGATPHVDALARESLLFTRFFSACSPTARSIFSVVTGIPDVNEPHSASRNPLAVEQNVIVNAFSGYEPMYLLGGSASWGNIRGVLARNIDGLRIYEEGDYDAPRGDVWGISDLDLFRAANDVFRQPRDRPFLAFIQTAGNHRPWTIPDDHGDFELVTEADHDELVAAGFDEGLPELNAIRFLDYSLGELIRLARQEDYYRETVFLIFADHGTWAAGDNLFARAGITRSHVPLIIHGPPEIVGPPRTIDAVASSLDILPTAAGLAGVPYENTTLGRDALAPRREGAERFAFARIPPSYALVGDDRVLAIGPDGTAKLFAYAHPDDAGEDVSAAEPATLEEMERLCRGLHDAARCLLHRTEPAKR